MWGNMPSEPSKRMATSGTAPRPRRQNRARSWRPKRPLDDGDAVGDGSCTGCLPAPPRRPIENQSCGRYNPHHCRSSWECPQWQHSRSASRTGRCGNVVDHRSGTIAPRDDLLATIGNVLVWKSSLQLYQLGRVDLGHRGRVTTGSRTVGRRWRGIIRPVSVQAGLAQR
jgi:hypothetical protein